MKRKTAITKVVLDLGSKQVELTTAEAKELFESLSEFFGEKQGVPYPVYIERPSRWWWTYPQPYWQSGSITFNSTAGSSFRMENTTLKIGLSSIGCTT